jgi:hypothetical protein
MGVYIKLFNVTFINISLSESGLKILNGNAFISKSEFKNINLNKNGDSEGGVLYLKVVETHRIEIREECYFENCSVNTNGISNGGAIYVYLKNGYFFGDGNSFKNCSSKSTSTNNEEGKGFFFLLLLLFYFILLFNILFISGAIYINIEESSTRFDLSNTTYTECSAGYGDNVFISGNSLSKVINKQKFNNIIFSSTEDEKLFYGEWKETNSYESLVNLMTESGAIYLNEDGSSDNTCGNFNEPCKYDFFYFIFYL